MKEMTSSEIRRAYLDFFEEMGHQEVMSSSLVPVNDPTLLFTNAGMVQFKDVFLGLDKRPYTRATTAQKCMRVSGKHNDLENVGPSPRHHTFFEMLGNFSFGDYFKADAIKFAHAVLTQVYELPEDRLYYTVFTDDDEAYALWTEQEGVDPSHVYRMGEATNFWQMADTGPCGPTTEMHWDRGPETCTCGEPDCSVLLDNGCDRWVEIWNLVFMQYNRQPDGTDVPLPAPGVDTGMGFERIVSILQGKDANYETDLFMPIIERTQRLAGQTDAERDANIVPYRVIADHSRAASFLIADGVVPGNAARNYICRMVIRRAVRFGEKLGFSEPFLADVSEAVIETMGEHYAELVERREAILQSIRVEEERFRRTLARGLEELDEILDDLESGGEVPGETAFTLYATHGLPFEITRDVAQERGFTVDEAGFRAKMDEHRIASGAGKAMGEIDTGEQYTALLKDMRESGQIGEMGVVYDPYDAEPVSGRVLAMLSEDGARIEDAMAGDTVEVVLPETHFYVESGGQVTDTGTITGEGWEIEVERVARPVGGLIVHIGAVVEGQPSVGDDVTAEVNMARRRDIMRNHTATHLLHAGLRAVLGEHVQQAGSLVAQDRLRFDFSHHEAVTREELDAIAAHVNENVLAAQPVNVYHTDIQTARGEGAIALFDEKYGEEVRTIQIGPRDDLVSYELCGGTHIGNTAEIGPFIIIGESSVGAGLRRIEAMTGHSALNLIRERFDALEETAEMLGGTAGEVESRVTALMKAHQDAEKENQRLRREIGRLEFLNKLENVQEIAGVPSLIAQVDETPVDLMREMADWFRDRQKSGVLVLGSVINARPMLLVAVTEDWVKEGLKAGDLVKALARIVGGGGGGRPTLATAGGPNAEALPQALAEAPALIKGALEK
jgi:alanyl-tRNA synthetase